MTYLVAQLNCSPNGFAMVVTLGGSSKFARLRANALNLRLFLPAATCRVRPYAGFWEVGLLLRVAEEHQA